MSMEKRKRRNPVGKLKNSKTQKLKTMKQTVTFGQFCDAFHHAAGRGEQFSYMGKKALFEYLEGWEDEVGMEIELDVIALCCDFTEYGDLDEFREDYGDEYETLEAIENETAVIRIDDSSAFIIQNF